MSSRTVLMHEQQDIPWTLPYRDSLLALFKFGIFCCPMEWEAFGQLMTDKLSPLPAYRWGFTGALVLLYAYRIFIIKSHAVVTYCAAVYLLHAFILFATPKDQSIPDPFEEVDEEYNPSNIDNDFRPYVRRLPEYSFWVFATQIVLTAFFLTLLDFMDIPVFIPILAMYFIFIVCMTAYKLWVHSHKFKYSLFFSSKSSLDQ